VCASLILDNLHILIFDPARTVLSYTTLRLLGAAPDAPYMVHARKFIDLHGGALYAPSWAKFWLAVIGVYDWKGLPSNKYGSARKCF
jgi:hypothetical protein